ncbi:MAG: helix-turn-helix transcriptional regulator [Clostridia bacterium]|nr:helix-turn-helix transcriptional regulator [Clostridia bacterium]
METENSTFFNKENEMFDMQKIGASIASLRRKAGLTQAELAERLGISYQAVSSWERGATMPDISKLKELSRALGTTVDALLDGETEEAEPMVVEDMECTSETAKTDEIDLADAVKRLISGVAQKVETFTDKLSGNVIVNGKPVKRVGWNCYRMEISDSENEQGTKHRLSAEAVEALASGMDQEMLEDVLVDAINDDDEEVVEEIACYLEPETIDSALLRVEGAMSTEMVEELAMVMSDQTLSAYLLNAFNEEDEEMAEACAVHISNEGMQEALSAFEGVLSTEIVETIVDYASSETLDLIIEKADIDDEDVLEALSGHLSREQMRTLLDRLRGN